MTRRRTRIVLAGVLAVACMLGIVPVALRLAGGSADASTTTQHLFATSARPTVKMADYSQSIELGVHFKPKVSGYATGMRFFKGGPANAGPHVGTLWSPDKKVLTRVTFKQETRAGWQGAKFSTPVRLQTGQMYTVSYHAPKGHFSVTPGHFAKQLSTKYLSAPSSAFTGGNGLFAVTSSSAYPNLTWSGDNYWVDISFVQQLSSTSTTVQQATSTTTTPATTATTTPVTTPGSTTPVTDPPNYDGPPSAPVVRVCGNSSVLSGPATAPAGAVTIPAGDNSRTIGLDSYLQPNTTYWLAPGVHTLGTTEYSQVIPKNGTTFIGAPGAILDGKGANRFAFTQHATNVTVKYLEIRGFNAPQDQGVVNHDSGNGWTVSNNWVHGNHGAALMAGSDNVIKLNCLDSNGQYGLNAYAVPSPVNLVVDRNEFSRNNTDDLEKKNPGCGCTGGMKFWDVNGATVTNNYVHDNLSVGLWADTNDRDFEFAGNYIADNFGVGLFYEISYNAYIHDNTFLRNAWGAGPTKNPGFPTGAIYLSESGGDSRVGGKYSKLDISNNVFTDNWSGVVMWENADRFCGSPNNTSSGYCTLVNKGVANASTCTSANIASQPYFSDCRWKTQNVSVHDNTFNMKQSNVPGCSFNTGCGFNAMFSNYGTSPSWSPYKAAVVQNAIAYNQNNSWANNTYHGNWQFMPFDTGHHLTLGQFQASPYNQEAGSSSS